MNWRTGDGHIQRNALEKSLMKYNDWILQTLSDSFQNAEKRHGTTHWQSVEDKREKKEKKKERGKKKKKERSEERWQQYTLFPFLFLSSSFPYSLLFLIFPSFLSVEETGKGKRENQERERKGRFPNSCVSGIIYWGIKRRRRGVSWEIVRK